jgi:hypothetical protein
MQKAELRPIRRSGAIAPATRCSTRKMLPSSIKRCGGPPRRRRLRSPSRVADTALSQKRLARTRTRSQSTTHPKAPTTRLTAPAYWKFESISLERRVRLSPDFASVPGQGPGFPPVLGTMPGGRVGRDAQSRAISSGGVVVSLSSYIPVPQCCWLRFRASGGVSRKRRRSAWGLAIAVEL